MEVLRQRLAVRLDLARERVEGCTELVVCRRKDGFHAEKAKANEAAAAAAAAKAKAKAGGDAAAADTSGANGDATPAPAAPAPAPTVNGLVSSPFEMNRVLDWDTSKKLLLNCRQCAVENVYVNGEPAQWKLSEYMKKVVVEDNVRDLKTFYAFLTENLLASKDGELSIEIPAAQVAAKRLTIRIEYHLDKPQAGLRFVGCGPHNANNKWSYARGTNDKRYFSYVYTYSSLCAAETLGSGCGARCWFPCVDTLSAKCPFELEVTAPLGLTIISGGLQHEATVNEIRGEQTVRFEYEDPVAPYNIGLCVGPFIERRALQADWIRMYHLPDAAPKTALRKATAHLKAAIFHMMRYMRLEKFPFPTYSQVFIDQEDAHVDVAPSGCVSFVSGGLLRSDRSPSADSPAGAGLMFEKHLHFEQARAAAYSFFGGRVGPKEEGDVWLVAGLAGFLAYRYADATWKQAEYKPPKPVKQANKKKKNKNASTAPPATSQATAMSREEQIFTGSTDPRELLTQAFGRMKRAKRRHEVVLQWHGPSGNVLQRPLQRPSSVSDPVNSCLWGARGIDLDCLLAQRAATTVHMLDKAANMDSLEEDDLGRDDPFAGLLCHYLRRTFAEDEAFKTWLRTGEPPAPDDQGPSRVALGEFSDIDLGDDLQKQLSKEQHGWSGLTEYDFLLSMCRISAFKPADFRAGDRDNFAAYWLKRCTFIEMRAAVEYKVATNELDFMFAQRGDDRFQTVKFPLDIRVVEEDDTWQYKRRITKGTARDPQKETIQMHTTRQRQRGGRKARTEKERISKWENPAALPTKDLLYLMAAEGDDQVWHNENPVKYVVVDPDYIWPRQIIWRQTEIMNLELLSDTNLKTDVLAQVQALRDLSLPKTATDNLVSRPGGQAQSGGGSGTAGGTSAGGSGTGGDSAAPAESAFDLRNLCAIAACIMDYRRPARVRAEAMLALAEWQSQHAPKKAYQAQFAGMPLEKRPGSHPWVALNLALLAIRKMMFHPQTGKLLPNDFGVPGEYAMKRAVVRALARMRARSLKPPDEVCDLVLVLLRDNDNSINKFDDGDYLQDLMVAAAEVVVNYVAGTYNEEEKGLDKVAESIGSKRTIRQVLGKYYAIIDHIHRYMHYDAIEPSAQHVVTVGCLRALSLLEAEGILEGSTPYFAYAVFRAPVRPENKTAAVIAAHDWGANVREEAFKAIVVAYINQRGRPTIFKASAAVNCSIEWLQVVKWLINSVAIDPCPQLRWNVVKFMLEMHADTITRTYPELDDHNSPSGLFYPLSDAPDDIDQRARVPTTDIVASLWATINESTEYDGRMRLAWAQLWRAIWRLKTPPIIEHSMTTVSNLGHFLDGWSDDVEYFSSGARPEIRGHLRKNNKRPAGIGFNSFGGLPPPKMRSAKPGAKRTTIKINLKGGVGPTA
ncbi:Transcription initiation factor TFIID subunit 2 [Hondaea fermentalgiana]|uniref:Transcription initiation factor TFIID subunit 2 n=1 Tax=Hondaea fermentalgiana TaxID=2315210 RepID=A0A2R5GG60_9STRA|nr:Transcription initiation factor TFIID subunit 2 [Hondaea fermentalgiana]|eukprot:GBG27231.1 Transcription initiation factor TFIID subunit 2 [Hondaea fermentalgiana]